MGLFDMLSISASALSAERQRAEVTSANLANAETTHTDTGGPYVRKEVVFSATNSSPFSTVLNRVGHFGAAGGRGASQAGCRRHRRRPSCVMSRAILTLTRTDMVAYPAINPVSEMVDLMGAVRAYQLNASAVTAAKQMIQQSIDILKTS